MFFNKIYLYNFLILIPEFFLSILFLFFLLFGVLIKKNNSQIIRKLIIFQLIFLFILQLNTLDLNLILANGLFFYDNLSKCIKLFLILSTIIYFFISNNYLINQKINFFENHILILISLFGLMLLTMSYNFISLYLVLEIQSLSFYILTVSQRQSILSAEASLKYFILGAVASSFILFGISYVYGSLGTLNFGQIYLIFSNIYLFNNLYLLSSFLFGFLFIFIGLFFKIGVAPFHLWLPDIYEGAPNHITAFFAIIPKLALIGLFIRLFFSVIHNFSFFFENFLLICSLSSLLVGSLITLKQMKIKRLLAYSSISHIGFILLGFIGNSLNNIQFILFYGIIYLLMSINIWSIYLSIFINQKPIKYITELTNIFQYNNAIAYLTSFNFFSMAGIPPLAGFFIKFFILLTLIQTSYVILTIFVILLSVISAFYYIRIIKLIFFEKKRIYLLNGISQINSYIILISSNFILFFIINPNYLLTYLYIINLNLLK